MRGRAFVVRKFRTSSGQVRTKPGHDAPIEDERDGSQRFPTRDTSKNSFWVALLTFGEGWHNKIPRDRGGQLRAFRGIPRVWINGCCLLLVRSGWLE